MEWIRFFDRYALSVFLFAIVLSIREISRPNETKSSLVTCFFISVIWPLALITLAIEEVAEHRRK
jgi:bacteriorhodopsin